MPTEDHSKIFQLYTEMAYGIAPTADTQQRITAAQLVDLIKEIEASHRGTNFFAVSQVTREATNKAPTPVFVLQGLKYGRCHYAKVSQVNGQIGFNYSNAVNKQRETEGKAADFVAKPSKYQPVEGSTAFEQLDGQLYLRYRPISTARSFTPTYVKAADANATQFEVVPADEVKQYKVASTPGVYQGLDKAVEIRKISLASIAAINIGGKDYVITDQDSTRSAIYKASGAPMPIEPVGEG